jgi:hypothetical protein
LIATLNSQLTILIIRKGTEKTAITKFTDRRNQIRAMTSDYNPTQQAHPLQLKDASLLLTNEYLPFEAGHAVTPDGMHHVAASTYMLHCTGEMVDWWFGFIHDTEQYKLWHPRDHVFSDWDGPRNNDSTYIGGSHLVEEWIGGNMQSLCISFGDPGKFFGPNWKEDFKMNGYSTAICGRVNAWDRESNARFGIGHLVHLIKDEPDGCRMRSRFWLGDFDDIEGEALWKTFEERAKLVDPSLPKGLLKHATEEMAILASQLPDLYKQHAKNPTSHI